MAAKRKGRLIFHSMEEFRNRYFPNEREHRIVETPEEARAMGIELAKETMKKLNLKLR